MGPIPTIIGVIVTIVIVMGLFSSSAREK